MHRFLTNNRNELIARCKAKVVERRPPGRHSAQLREAWESLRISQACGGDSASMSGIGVTATAHGKELPELGYLCWSPAASNGEGASRSRQPHAESDPLAAVLGKRREHPISLPLHAWH